MFYMYNIHIVHTNSLYVMLRKSGVMLIIQLHEALKKFRGIHMFLVIDKGIVKMKRSKIVPTQHFLIKFLQPFQLALIVNVSD